MKLLPVLAVVLLLSLSFHGWAQEVPSAALAKITKTYTDKGMKLQQTFVPDMKNRKALYKHGDCYPGKKVTIVSVLAAKPKDWLFKLRYNNAVINKKHKMEAISIDGASYWINKITAHAPAPALKNNSDKCMTILAYDKADIALPVYLLVFTVD